MKIPRTAPVAPSHRPHRQHGLRRLQGRAGLKPLRTTRGAVREGADSADCLESSDSTDCSARLGKKRQRMRLLADEHFDYTLLSSSFAGSGESYDSSKPARPLASHNFVVVRSCSTTDYDKVMTLCSHPAGVITLSEPAVLQLRTTPKL